MYIKITALGPFDSHELLKFVHPPFDSDFLKANVGDNQMNISSYEYRKAKKMIALGAWIWKVDSPISR